MATAGVTVASLAPIPCDEGFDLVDFEAEEASDTDRAQFAAIDEAPDGADRAIEPLRRVCR